jgi:hypothetical protein
MVRPVHVTELSRESGIVEPSDEAFKPHRVTATILSRRRRMYARLLVRGRWCFGGLCAKQMARDRARAIA